MMDQADQESRLVAREALKRKLAETEERLAQQQAECINLRRTFLSLQALRIANCTLRAAHTLSQIDRESRRRLNVMEDTADWMKTAALSGSSYLRKFVEAPTVQRTIFS